MEQLEATEKNKHFINNEKTNSMETNNEQQVITKKYKPTFIVNDGYIETYSLEDIVLSYLINTFEEVSFKDIQSYYKYDITDIYTFIHELLNCRPIIDHSPSYYTNYFLVHLIEWNYYSGAVFLDLIDNASIINPFDNPADFYTEVLRKAIFVLFDNHTDINKLFDGKALTERKYNKLIKIINTISEKEVLTILDENF